MRLIEHLLILQYGDSEKKRNRGHWQREILNFRLQIMAELEDSPSLNNHLNSKFLDCYQKGRNYLRQENLSKNHLFTILGVTH